MLDELRIKDMIQKADLLINAIEKDDRDALSDALEIPCDFCWNYKRKSTAENECCDDCPLWKATACHHSYIVMTDFRVVDRYYAYFKNQSPDQELKASALRSARRLREVIATYGKGK